MYIRNVDHILTVFISRVAVYTGSPIVTIWCSNHTILLCSYESHLSNKELLSLKYIFPCMVCCGFVKMSLGCIMCFYYDSHL